MSSFASTTSLKWISSNVENPERAAKEGHLRVHEIPALFQPVWKTPCNLIAIFGRARQGKSFLMNCLAHEQEVFRVSNEKESCTQGIDISNKWMDWRDFAAVDGAVPPRAGREASQLRIGFVDAEGQGDRDVSYDANLICPVLLTAKCVLFNWKGDLQKDNLLSTLGIMTRAAQNVASETNADKKGKRAKFGHLHIVFRDWQAVDTDPMNTYRVLFDMEPQSKDSEARNQIRKDLLEAFSSIRVWLFEAPTDSLKALKTRLTFDRTSASFRTQLREFRTALAAQLSTTTTFACNQPLTGQRLHLLMQSLVSTLNRGEVVLPASTYVNMMRAELHLLQRDYEKALRESVDLLCEQIRAEAKNASSEEEELASVSESVGKKRGSSSTTARSARSASFPTPAEVEARFSSALSVLEESVLRERLRDVWGDSSESESASETLSLQRDFTQNTLPQVQRLCARVLWSEYEAQCAVRLRCVRQRAEGLLESEMEALCERALCGEEAWLLSEDEVRACVGKMRESALLSAGLTHSLAESLSVSVSSAPPTLTQSLTHALNDTLTLFSRHTESLSQNAVTVFAQVVSQREEEMTRCAEAACVAMQQEIETSPRALLNTFTRGYSLTALERHLNGKHKEIKRELEDRIDALFKPPKDGDPTSSALSRTLRQSAYTAFVSACKSAHGTVQSLYNTVRAEKERDALQFAQSSLSQRLSALSATLFPPTDTRTHAHREEEEESDEEMDNEMDNEVEEVALRVEDEIETTWRDVVQTHFGWLSDTPSPPTSLSPHLLAEVEQGVFGKALFDFLQAISQPYREALVKKVRERAREREERRRERQREKERLERERQEKERQERERQERDRQEKERKERERKERERQEREKLERERQEKERQERERQEKERRERERLERERQERERMLQESSEEEEDEDEEKDLDEEEDEEEEEEEEEIVQETAKKTRTSLSVSSSSTAKASSAAANKTALSVNEQKLRAAQWAAQKFGLAAKNAKKGSTAAARAPAASAAAAAAATARNARAQSVQEQKERAAKFAASRFGAAAVQASDDESDEEDDDGDRRGSSAAAMEDVVSARRAAATRLRENQTQKIETLNVKPKTRTTRSKK